MYIEGPSPPIKKDRERWSRFTLSLSQESERVLSHCLFRDLHGTLDNSRYRRSVGVSCPAIFGAVLFAKAFCRFPRKWQSLRLRNVKHPFCLEDKLFCI